MEPGQDMGPLVTKEHRDKVAAYVDSGVEQEASYSLMDEA